MQYKTPYRLVFKTTIDAKTKHIAHYKSTKNMKIGLARHKPKFPPTTMLFIIANDRNRTFGPFFGRASACPA